MHVLKELIPFSGNPLDRAANLRRESGWLDEQLGAADSRYLPFWRLNVLARQGEEPGADGAGACPVRGPDGPAR